LIRSNALTLGSGSRHSHKGSITSNKALFITQQLADVLIIEITPVDSSKSASCSIFASNVSFGAFFVNEQTLIAYFTDSIFSVGYHSSKNNISSAALALSSVAVFAPSECFGGLI
jgi:hypothetical protein